MEYQNMESILSQAKEKGLYVVHNDECGEDKIRSDFSEVMERADRLGEVVDPEDKPFQSKYEARDILDQFLKQLEATKAIATLEKKSENVKMLNRLIAHVQTRIGSISWDCEEPHNAQTELEMACKYYFPNLILQIEEIVGNRDELLSTGESTAIDPVTEANSVTAPPLSELPIDLLHDAMKCLNLLGILWAGRGQPLKSLNYLLAANHCYRQHEQQHLEQLQDNKNPSNDCGRLMMETSKDFENIYTHNLFYLAQAYGNLKSMKKSSEYCLQTLQRQLSLGLIDLKSALEWVKNCCGLADYYLSSQQYHSCSFALSSAEKILKEKVIATLYAEMEKQIHQQNAHLDSADSSKTNQRPNFVMGNLNAAEIEADLHRRFAILDVQVLKQASDRKRAIESTALSGISLSEINSSYSNQEDQDRLAKFEIRTENDVESICFFQHLRVSKLSHLNICEIDTFETARKVFLRAASRIEAAKKYYVLDGYVTDHVILLQEQSKLFHYLNAFENDYKRKLAMESRRIEILGPVIKSLNIISYETLHKQISYELGETALALLDLKIEKLRNRDQREAIDEKALKKSEIIKCNEYAKQALVYFAHFTFLYAQAKDRKPLNTASHLETLQLHDLVTIFCAEPDESLISEEEIRPFLNANFLSCRVMSKIISHSTSLPPPLSVKTGPGGSNRAYFLIECLHRYEWILKFAPRISKLRGVAVEDIFGEEFKIAEDMVKLLPSKIDRMCYLGETGLSL